MLPVSIHVVSPLIQDHSRVVPSPVLLTRPPSHALSIHEIDMEMGHVDLLPPSVRSSPHYSSRFSVVNLGDIVGQRKGFALQQVDPFFH
jgi:hypothetical protein